MKARTIKTQTQQTGWPARRDALRTAVASGEYRVDCAAVAEAIVARLLAEKGPSEPAGK